MIESRRGRQIQPASEQAKPFSAKEQQMQYSARSAKQTLYDFVSHMTEDRIPQQLKEALAILETAKTIEQLSVLRYSPYKIVVDAASDEIRILQGLPPNSYYSRPQTTIEPFENYSMSLPGTIKQWELNPRDERFDLQAHGLGHKNGTVQGSYPRATHSTFRPSSLDGVDGVVKQAQPF
jgi:hypothetical protein